LATDARDAGDDRGGATTISPARAGSPGPGAQLVDLGPLRLPGQPLRAGRAEPVETPGIEPGSAVA